MLRYLSGGESHGPCLIAIIEGLPAGLYLSSDEINSDLGRRQQGYGRGGRMKIEQDRVEILSGLRFNRTLGSPLTLRIRNRDWENWRREMALEGKAPAGSAIFTRPRPGHADLAGGAKYNQQDLRNVLERSSARETALRVAVGSVARKLLQQFGLALSSRVLSIGPVEAPRVPVGEPWPLDKIERSPLRCPDADAERAMIEAIDRARREGDTLGGIFEVMVTGVPLGLGSHVHWDRRLDGRLARAVMSIQGIKGVELGEGFATAARPGSQVHDPIVFDPTSGVTRSSNRAGGLEGGITNGQPIIVRAAMKPIPTLTRPLPSVDLSTGEEVPAAAERSDVCAVPAASIVAEAVIAWELAMAFREKFPGDYMEEIEASFKYYKRHLKGYLSGGDVTGDVTGKEGEQGRGPGCS
ncbi:MAG: chorismate synthase [Firmicutes bacterium]|nr:chorismate synthase [Bacillota bacterium]